MIQEIISTYLIPILGTILTAVASFVGLKVKSIIEKYANDKTKKSVVESTVKYIEQIYSDLNGEDKLNKAIENATEMLAEKGIAITDLELRVLIESTCNSFKNVVKGDE